VCGRHNRQLCVQSCESKNSLDSSGYVIAQFLRSLQRSLDPDNFHLAGRDLSGRFTVTSRSHQAALVAGQHAPKNRSSTFLWLRMRTAEADQSLRTMFSGGQLVGRRMYRSLLKSVARVWNPKDIQGPEIQQKALAHMQAAERGLRRAEAARERAGLAAFAGVLGF